MSENDTKLSQSFTGWRGLITLISLLLSVPGLIKLGSYPWLASKHRVKATDLVLETLRQSSVIDTTSPFRRAFTNHDLNRYRIKFKGMDLPQFDRIEVEQKPNGLFLQKLILIDGRQEIHDSALRHFSVSVDTLIRAKEQIEVIINCALPGEKQANPQKNKAALLSWGEKIFKQYWVVQHNSVGIRGLNFAPNIPPSDDERLFCVWLIIDENLHRAGCNFDDIEMKVRSAFPDNQYNDAMLWAKHGLERSWTESDNQFGRPLPNTFLCWLSLARVVGLDAAARKDALQDWLKLFKKSKHQSVVMWGKELLQERRANKEVCLPGNDNLVCVLSVIERLFGLDDYSMRCRKAVKEGLNTWWDHLVVKASILLGVYPNDDVYLLGLSILATDSIGFGYIFVLALPLLYAWVIESLVTNIGETFSEISPDFAKNYEQYKKRRESFGLKIIGFRLTTLQLALPILAWLSNLYLNVDPRLRSLVSDNQLLIGCYATTFITGKILENCVRLFSFALIWCNQDPDDYYIDDFACTVITTMILWYFEVDFSSILLFQVAAWLPNVMLRQAWAVKKSKSPPKPQVRPQAPSPRHAVTPSLPLRQRQVIRKPSAPPGPPPAIDSEKNPFDFT